MAPARTGAQKAHISHLAARLAAPKHQLGDEAARSTTPRPTTRKIAEWQLEAITLHSTQLEVDLIERTNRVTQV
ncbi:hypothetical protein CPB83DRAFT_851815 [Crepidotus variabilis]|uniref:Uncharacterized protein n=1 Tax=Crepidotus variabilis TaxID=179855 RepID=A0A9P6EJ64_9AGAR|nr:hypothetical protein CPB83DRAFT_851815 [Crepidotus variabilis]